jgi:release factor glutamine methyltransferase
MHNNAKLVERLNTIYEIDEAKLISKYLIEDLFSNGIIDNLILEKSIERLLNNEPLQYITGKAYFLNYMLFVDKNVLIPRPETEELVIQCIAYIKNKHCNNVLEIGTGSGCIPIAVKDKCPNISISTIDISQGAIEVAKVNAAKYKADINFIHSDFLDEDNWDNYVKVDFIVSNPPYISNEESIAMNDNVLKYEPHIALFAGSDTLIFYKKIAKLGASQNVTCMCEINEYFGEEIKQIFVGVGYKHVELIKDLQGKNRIVKAEWK